MEARTRRPLGPHNRNNHNNNHHHHHHRHRQDRKSAGSGGYLLLACALVGAAGALPARAAPPDLTSAANEEPLVALAGQDAFVSCVVKQLNNYTLVWRFINDASGPSAAAQEPASGAGEPAASGQLLFAANQRVSADQRMMVLHSHDTWLLKISRVQASDTGTYICEANSQPRVRALRVLTVLPSQGPEAASAALEAAGSGAGPLGGADYNFTACCRLEQVGARCERLCSLQQLAGRLNSINLVHECYPALPAIARCMSAGRNLTGCCRGRHVPSSCDHMCGAGEPPASPGAPERLSVREHSECARYSAAIMSCVAEGVETLPGQPELVIVEALAAGSLKVSWQRPASAGAGQLAKPDGYLVELSELSAQEANSAPPPPPPQPAGSVSIVDVFNNASLAAVTRARQARHTSYRLPANATELQIDQLKPYTVYEVRVLAFNERGQSQRSDAIRALTLSAPELGGAGSAAADDELPEPQLPDTRKCCADRGVTLNRCLDSLCDPVEAERATVADLMICAPWSSVTFSCLASRVNHTECCRARAVSPFCLSLCSGEVKRVDYRHFRCLAHMGALTSCVLESHNVLPGPPRNFTVGPITHSWAVLDWRPPQKHAKWLQGYRIHWRQLSEPTAAAIRQGSANGTALASSNGNAPDSDSYGWSAADAATSPYLLDGLEPASVYEVYTVAVNRYGQSPASSRFLFQTLADPASLLSAAGSGGRQPDELEARLPLQARTQSAYNVSACCSATGVHAQCSQLCSYDMRVSEASALVAGCSSQMPAILRCMAGSRNSVPCCRARKVAEGCLNVCAGLTEHSPLVVAARCASDFGTIIGCMDEGARLIPAAPAELRALSIGSDRARLAWRPAAEDSQRLDLEYHVRYQRLADQPATSGGSGSNQTPASQLIAVVPLHPLEHTLVRVTNQTEFLLDGLSAGARYSVYLTAENGHGVSLPSLVLVFETTPASASNDDSEDQESRHATLGAPHALEVLRYDTESILLKWIAPLFIATDAPLRYRVFYKLVHFEAAGSGNSSSAAADQTAAAQTQQVSSNWTVLETGETGALLRNLRYSARYVISVQAFTKQLLGHMSELLVANTARPVPPTLNQPLVINEPVEGNNITLMCMALGQPVPQISMFINGLLVQKRTQPYVIYHLVNLSRGQLVVSCFASNGHGPQYASVQSRTEVSVRFGARAMVRARTVRVNLDSSATLACEVAGNPQPAVAWLFEPTSASGEAQEASSPRAVLANARIASLSAAKPESRHAWTVSLVLRNVSEADFGAYTCRARNNIAESADTVRLVGSAASVNLALAAGSALNATSTGELLRQADAGSDLYECCQSQNVTSGCLGACSADGLDVERAFRLPECASQLDRLMYCAADGRDHRNCCRARQVAAGCLRWCSGARPPGSGAGATGPAAAGSPNLCLVSAALDMGACFHEGRSLLPGPVGQVRGQLAQLSEHGRSRAAQPAVTTLMGPALSAGAANSSVINSLVMLMGEQAPAAVAAAAAAAAATGAADHLGAPGEPPQPARLAPPIVLDWQPPTKNPHLVQYYRVFWRPFGSRQLSRALTRDTWLRLEGLEADKSYEFVVKAANSHGASVYSEPLALQPAELERQAAAGLSGQASTASGGSSSAPAELVWTGSRAGAALGRIASAALLASALMLGLLATVLVLERRGYLRRFASSKSNGARVSFANPNYVKQTADDESATSDAIGVADLSLPAAYSDSGRAGELSLDVLSAHPAAGSRSSRA